MRPATHDSHQRTQRLAAGALALATSLISASATGYCRTSVCSGGIAGETCTPSTATDCGTPLFWGKPCIGYSVFERDSAQITAEQLEQVAAKAFATWQAIDCGGGQPPHMSASYLGRASCDRVAYDKEGPNMNLIVMRDEVWPYEGQGNTLALTTVTYGLNTGEIFDADLEINATSQVHLTLGDVAVDYDLKSIVTHEAGHMLGIAHSRIADATMGIEYVPGDTGLRSLEPDDVAALCEAYPPAPDEACDPTPRRGYAPACEGATPDGGCSCHGSPRRSSRAPLWLAGLLLLGLLRRRTPSAAATD